MSTTARVLIGLALGVLVGSLSTLAGDDFAARLTGIVSPVGTLWLNALRMTVVPLVVSLVIVGVADATSVASAGRITALALGLFVVLTTLVAIATALVAPAAYELWPGGPVDPGALSRTDQGPVPEIPGFGDQVANLLPSNAIAAAAAGAMVPLVLSALIVGFALTRLSGEQRTPQIALLRAVADTMLVIVGWVLRLAPLGVFALILPVAVRTGSDLIGAAGWYVVIQSCLKVAVLLAMYPVAVGLGGVALADFARAAAPAQGVGFGTQSSLATLPVMLDAATQRLAVPSRIAGVVLPLAVSLFRVTSPANTLGAACFVAWLYAIDLSFVQLASGALVAIVIALGSVSLPGQVTFAASNIPVLLAMGLPLEPVALLLALDPIPDAFRTAGNITGDLAVTTVVARYDATHAAPAKDPISDPMETAT